MSVAKSTRRAAEAMPLDRDKLLAHIKAKAEHPQLLVYSVLTGLATAIERGDFNQEAA